MRHAQYCSRTISVSVLRCLGIPQKSVMCSECPTSCAIWHLKIFFKMYFDFSYTLRKIENNAIFSVCRFVLSFIEKVLIRIIAPVTSAHSCCEKMCKVRVMSKDKSHGLIIILDYV